MTKPKPHDIDPAAAEKAFATLAPKLASIPDAELAPMGLDRRQAAVVAFGVANLVAEPDLHKRFTSLPEKEFKHSHLADVGTASLALWYCAVNAQTAAAASTDAKVPAKLLADATSIKSRLLKLLDYHVGDDPAAGQELADIVSGSGYLDLTSDLMRLA